jgi:hypothetical protein
MPRILLIPDRFMDYRMWADIPDRLGGRADVIHFDRHEQVPWAEADGGFLDAVRRLAGGGSLDIVAAAGQAARFGFAVAEAGLARGLVLFYPSLDRVPDEVISGMADVDPAQLLEPYRPIAEALHEEDASLRLAILVQVIRDTAGPDTEPAELARAVEMITDHAAEFFAELQAAQDAGITDRPQPEQSWIDHLATLRIPVTAVVTPDAAAVAEAITRRAPDTEIVLASPRLTPIAEPSVSARAITQMLDLLDRPGTLGSCHALWSGFACHRLPSGGDMQLAGCWQVPAGHG